MNMASAAKKRASRATWARVSLLFLWFLTSFGVAFFARDLAQVVAGWPLNFWLAAQGGVLVFIVVVMAYAWIMNRLDDEAAASVVAEAAADGAVNDESGRGIG